MLADKEKEYIRSIMAVQHDFVPQGCVEIPLYTRPVKELTDEEIEKVFQDETGFTLDCDAKVDEVAMLDFARAILRKAQTK